MASCSVPMGLFCVLLVSNAYAGDNVAATGQTRAGLGETPLNLAAVVGDTVTLVCGTTKLLPANYRIVWTEFVTNSGGAIVSDGLTINPSHPNAARYGIIQPDDDSQYYLQIRDVVLADGGTYVCQDFNSAGSDVVRGYAELIVLERPACETTISTDGIVVEGDNLKITCNVYYQGLPSPTLTWSGPQPYTVETSTSPTVVHSSLGFTVDRSMDMGAYQLVTNFTEIVTPLVDAVADNIPDLTLVDNFPQMYVYWGPKDLYAVPLRPFYRPGDTITCYADAYPSAFYMWININTAEQYIDQILTITSSMPEGSATFLCRAQNMIQGLVYEGNMLMNVNIVNS